MAFAFTDPWLLNRLILSSSKLSVSNFPKLLKLPEPETVGIVIIPVFSLVTSVLTFNPLAFNAPELMPLLTSNAPCFNPKAPEFSKVSALMSP